MLATQGSVEKLTPIAWAFEGKWDGYRLLVDADHGELQLRSRSGRDVTDEYPATAGVGRRSRRPPRHPRRRGRSRSTSPACRASARCRTGRARPASSSGRSTSCSSTADRCCGPSTPTGAGCSRRWRTAAASSCPTCCPVTAPRRWSTPASTGGRASSPRSGTPPTSRAAARSRGSRTSIWRTQEVVIGGWRAGRAAAPAASARC